MTCEMTADGMFNAGQPAPRGTYICVESGLIHRLTRPTVLPHGGPFRQVAPVPIVGGGQSTAPASTWPEEQSTPAPEMPDNWLTMLLAFRLSGPRW